MYKVAHYFKMQCGISLNLFQHFLIKHSRSDKFSIYYITSGRQRTLSVAILILSPIFITLINITAMVILLLSNVGKVWFGLDICLCVSLNPSHF